MLRIAGLFCLTFPLLITPISLVDHHFILLSYNMISSTHVDTLSMHKFHANKDTHLFVFKSPMYEATRFCVGYITMKFPKHTDLKGILGGITAKY